jgi:hypothetical protein
LSLRDRQIPDWPGQLCVPAFFSTEKIMNEMDEAGDRDRGEGRWLFRVFIAGFIGAALLYGLAIYGAITLLEELS